VAAAHQAADDQPADEATERGGRDGVLRRGLLRALCTRASLLGDVVRARARRGGARSAVRERRIGATRPMADGGLDALLGLVEL
jgi:hypothetical protein